MSDPLAEVLPRAKAVITWYNDISSDEGIKGQTVSFSVGRSVKRELITSAINVVQEIHDITNTTVLDAANVSVSALRVPVVLLRIVLEDQLYPGLYSAGVTLPGRSSLQLDQSSSMTSTEAQQLCSSLTTLVCWLKGSSLISRALSIHFLQPLFAASLVSQHYGSSPLRSELLSTFGARTVFISGPSLLMIPQPEWFKFLLKNILTDALCSTNGIRAFASASSPEKSFGQFSSEQISLITKAILGAAQQRSKCAEAILPQLLDLLTDQTDQAPIYRHMSFAIMKFMIVQFPADVLSYISTSCNLVENNFDSETQVERLRLLTELTQDEIVAQFLLSVQCCSVLTIIATAGPDAQPGLRDQCARLIQRSLTYVPVKDLDRNILNFLTSACSSSSSVPINDQIDKVLKVISQLTMSYTVVLDLFFSLFDYAHGFPQDVSQTQLYLFLSKFYVNIAELPEESVESCLQHIADRPHGLSGTHEAIAILLALLKALLDRKVSQVDHRQSLESIMTSLQKLLESCNDDELLQLATILRAQIQLYLASASRIPSSKTSSKTSSDLHVQSSGKEHLQKEYHAALIDLDDEVISNRAHGLFLLSKIATSNKDFLELNTTIPLIINLLGDDEVFVHQHAIKTIVQFINIYKDSCLELLQECLSSRRYSETIKARIREAIARKDQ